MKLKKEAEIQTTTWLEEPVINLKLKVWTNSNMYFEGLGMGYLRRMEHEYISIFKSDGIPEEIKKIVVGYLLLENLPERLDWNEPLLFTLINYNSKN